MHLAIQQKNVATIKILIKNKPHLKEDSLYFFHGDYNFSEMLELKEDIEIEEFQFTDDKKMNVILDKSSKLDEDIISKIREKVGQDIEISYNSISKSTLPPIITDINNVSRLETSQHFQ